MVYTCAKMFELALPSRAEQQSSERLCEVHYHRCCLLAGPLPTLCLDTYVCMPGTISWTLVYLLQHRFVCSRVPSSSMLPAELVCPKFVPPRCLLTLSPVLAPMRFGRVSPMKQPHGGLSRRPSRRRKTPNRPETEQTNDRNETAVVRLFGLGTDVCNNPRAKDRPLFILDQVNPER